jgi:hypothetical protein
MRMTLALAPLLMLGACNVSTDDKNDGVTVQYDQNLAENAAADVGNFAQNVGGAIATDVQDTAAKVENRVDNTDVDVDVDTNTQSNTQ